MSGPTENRTVKSHAKVFTTDDLRARLRRERDELIDRIEYVEDSLAALDAREDPGPTEAWADVL